MSIWKKKKTGITFAELMISLVVISVVAAILYPTIAQFTPNANKPLFKAAYNTLSVILAEITNTSAQGQIDTSTSNDNATDEDGNNIVDENGDAVIISYNRFCMNFCEIANVVQEGDAASDCQTYCADNILTTSNGMRWRFYDYGNYSSPSYDITTQGVIAVSNVFQLVVDVNASNNDLEPSNCADDPSKAFSNDCKGVFYFETSTDEDKGIYCQTVKDNLGNDIDCLPTQDKPDGYFNSDHIKAQDTFVILIDRYGKIVDISPAGWAHLEDSLQSPD